MGIEIERKFLVDPEAVMPYLVTGTHYEQGYLPTKDETTVRVRIAEDSAFLTIKGQVESFTRSEFEYPIPVDDARMMLNQFCPETIQKMRYPVPFEHLIFEVDLFEGENKGLIVAEVELSSETEAVPLPHWITQEVTKDPRYYNSQLLKNPVSRW